MESSSVPHRIGYWLSERKSKKFNMEEFRETCRQSGLELVKVMDSLQASSNFSTQSKLTLV